MVIWPAIPVHDGEHESLLLQVNLRHEVHVVQRDGAVVVDDEGASSVWNPMESFNLHNANVCDSGTSFVKGIHNSVLEYHSGNWVVKLSSPRAYERVVRAIETSLPLPSCLE